MARPLAAGVRTVASPPPVKFEKVARPLADGVANIDARRLYRLGLFGPTPEVMVVPCTVDSAENPEVEIRVAWEPADSQVHISLPGVQGLALGQPVAVGRRENPRGGGYYFLCPVSGERCEKLYYVDGGWGGRRGKRLSYSSQGGSMADRHRHSLRRLTGILEGAGGRMRPTAEERVKIEARIEALERRIEALPRRKPRAEVDPRNYSDLMPLALSAPQGEAPAALGSRLLGTEAALERAAALGDVEDRVGWLFHGADRMRPHLGRPPEGLAEAVQALRPDFIEDHPRVSLRVLQTRGYMVPGRRRGTVLDWAGLGCELDRCALLFDLRDDDVWLVILEASIGREVVEQALRMTISPEGEPRVVCPLSGAEVETIAYRAGGFAAPHALRLTRRLGRI